MKSSALVSVFLAQRVNADSANFLTAKSTAEIIMNSKAKKAAEVMNSLLYFPPHNPFICAVASGAR